VQDHAGRHGLGFTNINLGQRIVAINKRENKSMNTKNEYLIAFKCMAIAVLLTLGIPTLASAQTTVPNTFVAGAAAKAADVNANFQALVTAINALTTRVTKLEGSSIAAADLAGTWTLIAYQAEIDNGGNIQHEIFNATCTLTATTYSCPSTGSGVNNNGGGGWKTFTETVSNTGTLTLSGSTVTLTATGGGSPGTLTVSAGGSLLVGVQSSPNPNATTGGTDQTLILLVNQ
jgi:hypothetical protein